MTSGVWRLTTLLLGLCLGSCATLGHPATGARLERMMRSPNYDRAHRHFVNPQPLISHFWAAKLAFLKHSPDTLPRTPVPVQPVEPAALQTPPASGLRVTWFGHSTMLVELDGKRILTDPVWSHRAGPFPWAGPVRFFEPLIPLEQLGPIDAVVISHDHFDHLDAATITAMKDWPTRFIVPLGVGADLEAWGIAPERITELDWWDTTQVGTLKVVCLPARHTSGRTLVKDQTLWAGWGLIGPQHRVYYSGDTSLFPAMRTIGRRYGPFDLTLIDSGQYNTAWADWHLGPEQAVQANALVRGKVLMPVHWALFATADHGWTEPGERTSVESARVGSAIALPRPGQPLDPLGPLPTGHWWPTVPWDTAAESPVVSSQGR